MTKTIRNIIIIFFFTFQLADAKDSIKNPNNFNTKNSTGTQKIKIIASPNWVHPSLRRNNAGYKKLIEQKKLSPMWRHTTNRPSGNIIGGGTTKYNDYKPFFIPSQKK
jgi:hypothetical protein